MRKKLLFVCYGGGHVAIMIPVLRELASRSDIECTVLGLTTAEQRLREAGIPSLGFRHFLRPDDDCARSMGDKLIAGVENEMVSLEESRSYLGLSYCDLIAQVGENEAERLYSEKGRAAFLPLSVLERIIDSVKPDLVVTTNSPRAERAALFVANRCSIPSVAIVNLFGIVHGEWLSRSDYGTRLCVLSESVRQRLVERGREPETIVVTGNPEFDALWDQQVDAEAHDMRENRGWRDKTVILWASQLEPERSAFHDEVGDPQLPMKIERELSDFVKKNSDYILLIRPHPSECRKLTTQCGRIVWSGQDELINVVLHAVDVVVTIASTVGLQAHLVGKPVVTVDLSLGTVAMPMSKMGVSRGVTEIAALGDAIIAAVQTGPLNNAGFLGDGAAVRVVNVIDELLEDSQ